MTPVLEYAYTEADRTNAMETVTVTEIDHRPRPSGSTSSAPQARADAGAGGTRRRLRGRGLRVRSADRIALQVVVLAPGARSMTTSEVAAFTDTIVLALPMHRFRELPPDLFDGKVLIDAMNYWPETDGDDPTLAEAPDGTSSVVQHHFSGARVVKSLNQLGYHELDEFTREPTGGDRIAIAAAGDDRLAVRTAMHLIDRLGFDAVDAGPLANGRLSSRTAPPTRRSTRRRNSNAGSLARKPQVFLPTASCPAREER